MVVHGPARARQLGALYGGAPLAGAIELVEASFAMATCWATIRFLHGAVIGDDRTVFEVMLGIGSGRDEALTAQYLSMPVSDTV